MTIFDLPTLIIIELSILRSDVRELLRVRPLTPTATFPPVELSNSLTFCLRGQSGVHIRSMLSSDVAEVPTQNFNWLAAIQTTAFTFCNDTSIGVIECCIALAKQHLRAGTLAVRKSSNSVSKSALQRIRSLNLPPCTRLRSPTRSVSSAIVATNEVCTQDPRRGTHQTKPLEPGMLVQHTPSIANISRARNLHVMDGLIPANSCEAQKFFRKNGVILATSRHR